MGGVLGGLGRVVVGRQGVELVATTADRSGRWKSAGAAQDRDKGDSGLGGEKRRRKAVGEGEEGERGEEERHGIRRGQTK